MNRTSVNKNQSFGSIDLEGLDIRGFVYIGKLLNMKFYASFNGDSRKILVIDPNSGTNKFKIVMNIELIRDCFLDNTWFVEEVGIASKYQGFGFAPKAYRFVMQSLNIIIRSGEQQSAGGRYIWNELNKYSDIDVYAVHMEKLKSWYDVESTDDGELECDELQLYEYEEYDDDVDFDHNQDCIDTFLIAIPV